MSELDGTRTISIPPLAFNYVNNRLESIGYQGELYYGERGTHAPHAGTRWHELFSTPERAARTLYEAEGWTCPECPIRNQCKSDWPHDPCPTNDYDSLLEWLRGDA